MELTKEYFEQTLAGFSNKLEHLFEGLYKHVDKSIESLRVQLETKIEQRFQDTIKHAEAYTDKQTGKLALMIAETIDQPFRARFDGIDNKLELLNKKVDAIDVRDKVLQLEIRTTHIENRARLGYGGNSKSELPN